MTTIHINCLCGNNFSVQIEGEGSFYCNKCKTQYFRKYIGKGLYEIYINDWRQSNNNKKRYKES